MDYKGCLIIKLCVFEKMLLLWVSVFLKHRTEDILSYILFVVLKVTNKTRHQ